MWKMPYLIAQLMDVNVMMFKIMLKLKLDNVIFAQAILLTRRSLQHMIQHMNLYMSTSPKIYATWS